MTPLNNKHVPDPLKNVVLVEVNEALPAAAAAAAAGESLQVVYQ